MQVEYQLPNWKKKKRQALTLITTSLASPAVVQEVMRVIQQSEGCWFDFPLDLLNG